MLDLSNFAFSKTNTVSLTGDTLSVTGHGETLTFDLSNPNASGYRLSSDEHGGTRVTAAPAPRKAADPHMAALTQSLFDGAFSGGSAGTAEGTSHATSGLAPLAVDAAPHVGHG